ncbi:uncharacterized protein EV154DRAFT_102094 [Mucor mucedo]|uniref:uncharacterized protein n=1 Tax=Mucor mucedo TaxID=29922 RepID=UPI00221F81CC|nr:uncharacterized protein EV154DRAFT_102094 [Mucor mucedo]KAI7873166.1 hypothetical protein EV154DRAFT_102094 [Mucor mucedo]
MSRSNVGLLAPLLFILRLSLFNGQMQFLVPMEVMSQHGALNHDTSIPGVKMMAPTQTPKYAVVNVNDIISQVGLVTYPQVARQFYVMLRTMCLMITDRHPLVDVICCMLLIFFFLFFYLVIRSQECNKPVIYISCFI